MADFLIKHKDNKFGLSESAFEHLSRRIELNSALMLYIRGSDRTYRYYERGSDFICSFGYVFRKESFSMEHFLTEFLTSFEENSLADIKETVLGQFVLIIKKQTDLFIINDFLGGRNIFYSPERKLITSSFLWAEESVGCGPDHLDYYKILEYLALREVKYPTWLGSRTMNREIKWLLPYQYIKLDLRNARSELEIKPLKLKLDNRKDSNLSALAEKLIHQLSGVMERREFLNQTVGCSLTGGRDSRLIATLAGQLFPGCRYRIAVSELDKNSLKDFKIARKISRINKVQLDVYEFKPEEQEPLFRVLTEELIPAFNISITPLILNNYRYALTFGGVYGTEIFEPIFIDKIDKFIKHLINRVRSSMSLTEDLLDNFVEGIKNQISEIKKSYSLAEADDTDYIRMFQLFITARYSSFIISAMAQYGFDLEPYGSFPLIELAFQIDPTLWGNRKTMAGDALVQKTALFKISREAARVLAFSSFRPVMPFSLRSSLRYFFGYLLHVHYWARKEISEIAQKKQTLMLPGIKYTADGWYKYFISRIGKYVEIKSLFNEAGAADLRR